MRGRKGIIFAVPSDATSDSDFGLERVGPAAVGFDNLIDLTHDCGWSRSGRQRSSDSGRCPRPKASGLSGPSATCGRLGSLQSGSSHTSSGDTFETARAALCRARRCPLSELISPSSSLTVSYCRSISRRTIDSFGVVQTGLDASTTSSSSFRVSSKSRASRSRLDTQGSYVGRGLGFLGTARGGSQA